MEGMASLVYLCYNRKGWDEMMMMKLYGGNIMIDPRAIGVGDDFIPGVLVGWSDCEFCEGPGTNIGIEHTFTDKVEVLVFVVPNSAALVAVSSLLSCRPRATLHLASRMRTASPPSRWLLILWVHQHYNLFNDHHLSCSTLFS